MCVCRVSFDDTKEEIGKVFILLDMIKLDFAKHESTLRRLCRAFHNHGVKLAYTMLNTAYVNVVQSPTFPYISGFL